MRLPGIPHLLLALALLFGQAITAAHGYEHSALSPDHGCQVCSHVQALGTALAPTNPLPVFCTAQEAPLAAAPCAPVRRDASFHPIRGPPSPSA